jgi:hypothetical protein
MGVGSGETGCEAAGCRSLLPDVRGVRWLLSLLRCPSSGVRRSAVRAVSAAAVAGRAARVVCGGRCGSERLLGRLVSAARPDRLSGVRPVGWSAPRPSRRLRSGVRVVGLDEVVAVVGVTGGLAWLSPLLVIIAGRSHPPGRWSYLHCHRGRTAAHRVACWRVVCAGPLGRSDAAGR